MHTMLRKCYTFSRRFFATLPSRHPDQEKWRASGFSLALIGAVLWPIVENWRHTPRDNFPLSYYPMFSARRSKTIKVTYLVGVDPAGQRCPIPYNYIGPGGLNQMRKHIQQRVRIGQADVLCHAAATAIRRRGHGPLAQLTHIEVVTGTYRLNSFFRHNRAPVSELVHLTYPLEGSNA